jgi:predicted membrane chloride channel (bestrophin family)
MNFKNSLGIIFNLKSLILTGISIALTFVCLHYGIIADLPLTLLGIAVVFPIVFSISEAYKRRETALAMYGNLKAHSRALFFATRDWLEVVEKSDTEQIKILLHDVLISCRDLLHSKIEEVDTREIAVYSKFSNLSMHVKVLRSKGLPSGEASRANQYISKMLDAFENMKHIYQYRTPRSLRNYSKIFIYSTPILYAPYFAKVSQDLAFGLVFVTPILLTTMLVGLDNIQDQLENPFDQYGVDDVKINPEKFIENLDD